MSYLTKTLGSDMSYLNYCKKKTTSPISYQTTGQDPSNHSCCLFDYFPTQNGRKPTKVVWICFYDDVQQTIVESTKKFYDRNNKMAFYRSEEAAYPRTIKDDSTTQHAETKTKGVEKKSDRSK
jgi:hypothetical protein